MLKPPITLSSTIVYNDYIKIRKDTIALKGGDVRPYSCLILPGNAAIILAQDKDEKYIINYEYRYPAKQFLYGCPGGLLEEGEDPLIGGRRELLEETGYETEEICLTGCAYPFPGICDQKIYYLWAKNAVKTRNPKPDPLEMIETHLKTEKELRHAIRTQPNIDAILCTALWYKEAFLKFD